MTDHVAAADAKPPGSPLEDEIGILERRRIEADVIAPIFAEMRERFGEEQAKAVIETAIRRAAVESGEQFAARTPGGTSMRTFQEIQVLWTKDDALTVEVVTATDDRFDFNVRRCRLLRPTARWASLLSAIFYRATGTAPFATHRSGVNGERATWLRKTVRRKQ